MMKHKHYFLLTLAALFLIALACWFSGAALGSQAGTIALGYAVGEQAQANQEMARALGTQSRSNAWIIFFVVAGMLAAMTVGIWAGTRSTRQAPSIGEGAPIAPTGRTARSQSRIGGRVGGRLAGRRPVE